MRVIHTQNMKSHKQINDSRHNYRNHATITRFTPQLYESRHNFTIHTTNYMNHAKITRFTSQSQESRHKETAVQSWAQNIKFTISRLFPRAHERSAEFETASGSVFNVEKLFKISLIFVRNVDEVWLKREKRPKGKL